MATKERQVRVDPRWITSLEAGSHTHASVWIALTSPLVDTHAPSRPLIIATEPLSTRPPATLAYCRWRDLYIGALAENRRVLPGQRGFMVICLGGLEKPLCKKWHLSLGIK